MKCYFFWRFRSFGKFLGFVDFDFGFDFRDGIVLGWALFWGLLRGIFCVYWGVF